MAHRLCFLSLCVFAAACQNPGPQAPALALSKPAPGPRVLAVTAHPDDEIAFAGILYKTATQLGGTCDLLVVTNGEAGYRYSTLAEAVYGVKLTDPDVGRARLPEIRAAELHGSARILHVRDVVMLRQQDHRNTKDALEVLGPNAKVWDLARVRAALDQQLRNGHYDFVLTLLPVPDTHGHHKAATILALEAVARLPLAQRPVVLGAGRLTSDQNKDAPPYRVLEGFADTEILPDAGPFAFDLGQKLGYEDKLDYRIVVNWAIAEHKSQGTMQKFMASKGDSDLETLWLYALPAVDAADKARRWFAALAQKPQGANDAIALCNGRDLAGWHADVPAADGGASVPPSFAVKDGLLVSQGEPQGHLITDASFRDYRLTVEWRWPGEPGNCGVLVHCSTPRRLYGMFPQSIECQLHAGNAGDFWCIGEDIAVPDMERRRGPKANWGVDGNKARRILNLTDGSEKPPGEWNQMVIECRGRDIAIWVNGDLVNEGHDCTADHGQIAIQAEGAACEFRKLELQPLH